METYNVILQKEKYGGYSANVPSLPGCFSQGDNFEETIHNVQEAIELYLEDDGGKIKINSKEEFMVPVTIKHKYA